MELFKIAETSNALWSNESIRAEDQKLEGPGFHEVFIAEVDLPKMAEQILSLVISKIECSISGDQAGPAKETTPANPFFSPVDINQDGRISAEDLKASGIDPKVIGQVMGGGAQWQGSENQLFSQVIEPVDDSSLMASMFAPGELEIIDNSMNWMISWSEWKSTGLGKELFLDLAGFDSVIQFDPSVF